MNALIISVAVWVALVITVVALVFYRRSLKEMADETVTFVEGELHPGRPATFAKKADQLRKWINVLAAVVVIYGLALLLIWFRGGNP